MANKVKIEAKQILTFFLFAACAFAFLLYSPLNPFGNAESLTDSSVFRAIAMMMEKGFVPYRDTFDHKGPLLFLINFAGTVISKNHGVWLIEYFSLLITAMALFRSARVVNKSYFQCIFSVILSLSLLSVYFEQGNLTEEYAMPFLSVSLYIFLDYIIHTRVTNFRILVCGFCFGAVCLLRPNMVGLWVVFCFFIFVSDILKKRYAQIGKFVIWFLVGMCIIILPILGWLYINGALEDFWFDYITFNSIYSSSAGGRASTEAILQSMRKFSSTFVFILSLQVMIFSFVKNFKNKEKRFLSGVYLVYMLINLPLLAMSGMAYGHYGMLLIPSITFPIAILFRYISKKQDKLLVSFVAVMLFLNVLYIPCKDTAKHCYSVLKNNEQPSAAMAEMIDVIQNNSNADETISVYGNNDLIYVLSDRVHATKYSYQFPIGTVYPPIMEEYRQGLSSEKPKLIIITPNHYDEDMMNLLHDNQYTLLWTNQAENGYSIYIHND